MKTNKGLVWAFLLSMNALIVQAQLREQFSDGNFSTAPSWGGTVTDWMINSDFQLQSNSTIANSSYYLSTVNTRATEVEWEFYTLLAFNTSSANYVDIFLTASASDLTANTTTGYFIRIGSTEDEISLYRKMAGGAIIKMIDGTNGTTNTSNNTIKIKVTRDAANQWTLYRDITGTGTAYSVEGIVTDASYITSAFFGILIKQSTPAFFQRHYFDDISIQAYTPDRSPASLQSAFVLSPHSVDVLFNEALENASAQLISNYVASNGLGSPATAIQDPFNSALVHLSFTGSISPGVNYELKVNDVKDLSGNALVNGTVSFMYLPLQPYDVIITEVMADPLPLVGMPNYEWIELKNISGNTIPLQGWRLADIGGRSGPMPNFLLKPDSVVIVCSASAVNGMSAYGTAIAVPGFPSLDNAVKQLSLLSSQNNIIHAINYNDGWYQDESKKAGGWSLEMIDTGNPCAGSSNWRASKDARGGSPGKKNSVDGVNVDERSPRLLRAYSLDSINIVLVFDEPLDSSRAATISNYTVSNGIGKPLAAAAVAPFFDRVHLRLAVAIEKNKLYTVTAVALDDCVGNSIGINNTARIGIPATAAGNDVIINEILFNPVTNGSDYVEIYNRGNKIIDLKQLVIANRNNSGSIINAVPISAESWLLFPQDFLVITESSAKVKAANINSNTDAFIEVGNMPPFNNDKGTALILNAQSDMVDELAYHEQWHFNLINNREGVALERINYNAPTQSKQNWHSAATSSGYGTPGYRNSQYRVNDAGGAAIKLSPDIISPDNDGQDDFATIDYQFPEAGYVANITVFSSAGKSVRQLQKNALCGTLGSFRWDGLGEKNERLSTGIYILFAEVFNLKGSRQQFKMAVVLARRN